MERRANGHILAADLGKYFYCWFIVFYHYYNYYVTGQDLLPGGKFGVEYFLLAAGVFFFRHLDRHPDETPGAYIGHRFARLFPWALTAFVFAFAVIRLYINRTFAPRDLATSLARDIWEVLLVKANGMNHGKGLLNSPAWTISSMFLVEIVMVGCFTTCKKPFLRVLLPMSLMAGFGYWRHVEVAGATTWIGFTTFGTLRVWLVYGCAWYCYRLSEALRRRRFGRRGQVLLTGAETLCHVLAIWMMLRFDTRYFQWCALLVFFIAVAIATSGHSLWNDLVGKCPRAARSLGTLSLSVYLVHWPVIKLFRKLWPAGVSVAAMIGAVLVCSLVHCMLTECLIRLCRRLKPRLTEKLIKSPAA